MSPRLILIRIKPDISVSEILRLVKANSSKWVNGRPDEKGQFAWERLWCLHGQPFTNADGQTSLGSRRQATIFRRCAAEERRRLINLGLTPPGYNMSPLRG